jgi:hypothetical protein
MPNRVSVITMAGLSLAGATLGLYLGRSAIGEVDPFYYSPVPPVRFYADLVPPGYQPAAPASFTSADYAVNQLNVSGRPECFDCRNFYDDALESEAALPEPAPAPAPTMVMTAEAAPAAETAPAVGSPTDILRYADFPVTSEEFERRKQAAPVSYASQAQARASSGVGEVGPIGM